jgi:hypothetical protein
LPLGLVRAFQFAVALASEAVLRFLLEGQRRSYSFTLRDLHINAEGVEP